MRGVVWRVEWSQIRLFSEVYFFLVLLPSEKECSDDADDCDTAANTAGDTTNNAPCFRATMEDVGMIFL